MLKPIENVGARIMPTLSLGLCDWSFIPFTAFEA